MLSDDNRAESDMFTETHMRILKWNEFNSKVLNDDVLCVKKNRIENVSNYWYQIFFSREFFLGEYNKRSNVYIYLCWEQIAIRNPNALLEYWRCYIVYSVKEAEGRSKYLLNHIKWNVVISTACFNIDSYENKCINYLLNSHSM